MTYFEGFVVPVAEANRDSYIEHATKFAPLLRELGVERHVENWDSDVPEGTITDFRKAVDAKPGEKIVFAWFEYSDRAARNATNQKMMSDQRMMEIGSDMPFDGMRMVMGGFDSIVDDGAPGGGYTDGIVVPVREDKRDSYRDMAAKNAAIFREYGATRVVEALADDVNPGKVTDFYRAVKAEPGETISFAFIEWPDKAARDSAWQKIMSDDRMQHSSDGAMDGKRMFWGGFETFLDTKGS